MDESLKPGIISSAPATPDKTHPRPKNLAVDLNALPARVDDFLTSSGFSPLLGQLAMLDPNIFLVGGSIRDLALGVMPAELDVASALSPDEVMSALTDAGIRVIPTGLQHGTVLAVIDGVHCEITTLRIGNDFQRAANDNSEPADKPTLPIEIIRDLSARDFTINSVGYLIAKKAIIDPLNGLDDLINHKLRSCGSALERFREDPLRILRMIRFGAASGRSVDAETLAAAKEITPRLDKVSAERIQQEFSKIIVAEYTREALEQMREVGIFPILLPEILPSIGFEQNEFHSEDVYQHTLSVVAATPPDLTVRLAALFHDFGKPHTLTTDEDGRRHFYEHEMISEQLAKQIMTRLKFSHEIIKNVGLLARMHMRPLQCGMPGVRRLLRELDTQFEHWRQLKRADHPGALAQNETDTALAAFDSMVADEYARRELDQKRKLVIDGYKLMELGVPAGRQMGLLIHHLQELVLDDPAVNDEALLIQESKKWLSKTGIGAAK